MKTLTPEKTPEQVNSDLICASMEWVDLRDRVARTGERDAQLKARRDQAMDNICKVGGLLDQFIVINELDHGA
jgi:hypothetical protein